MKEKIRDILKDLFQMDIDDSFSKFSTSKWDSLRHLDILVAIEKDLKISFTPDEMGAINSYQDLVNIVNKKHEK